MNRYFMKEDGIDGFSIYRNSIGGEKRLRDNINFILGMWPRRKITVIYGEDVTSQFIEKGEDENEN